ncbi:hypothetical protein CCACVL1_25590 [Corchorus capsularis]|uniref:Uncharacterized protein n=1 Tax=Corchorus capsularis TaxID=210143 RepID=A0A1R3GJ40_COCAP|nr:hypothetical protein CCACVL1_25590 [Corchorus capsularis]
MATQCHIKRLNNQLDYHHGVQHQEHQKIRKEVEQGKKHSLHIYDFR